MSRLQLGKTKILAAGSADLAGRLNGGSYPECMLGGAHR